MIADSEVNKKLKPAVPEVNDSTFPFDNPLRFTKTLS